MKIDFISSDGIHKAEKDALVVAHFASLTWLISFQTADYHRITWRTGHRSLRGPPLLTWIVMPSQKYAPRSWLAERTI